MFDYSERLAELRCRTTEWLETRRAELVAEQRRLRVEELAVVAVLDERGAAEERWRLATGCRCGRGGTRCRRRAPWKICRTWLTRRMRVP